MNYILVGFVSALFWCLAGKIFGFDLGFQLIGSMTTYCVITVPHLIYSFKK